MNSIIADPEVLEANRLHDEVMEIWSEAAEKSLPKLIRIGEILTRKREKFPPRSGWSKWFKANFKFSRQSADNYMRLYVNRSILPTVGSIADAYRVLGIMSKPTPKERKELSDEERAINDEISRLAKARFEEEEKAKDIARLKREAEVVEIELENVEEDDDFEQEESSPQGENREEFEARVENLLETMRKDLENIRGLESVPENKIAAMAQIAWKGIVSQCYKADKLRIAKATIKMLYKKYPQLMDEA